MNFSNTKVFISPIAGCGHDEFVPMYGSNEGSAIKVLHDTTMAHCAKECSKDKACGSFVWIPEDSECELNYARIPNGNATIGVVFCSRAKKGKINFKII